MRDQQEYEYIIVGAGAAGLQMAYFLQRSGRSYVVYEESKHAANFFSHHPRNSRLISINKVYNIFEEDDFNMRHDWNSLLSDDPTLRFTKYSEELFPNSADLCKYLREYAQHLQLNIEYCTKVVKISKRNSKFFVTAKKVDSAENGGFTCTARCVLMATGAVGENLPENIEGLELTDTYSKYKRDKKLYQDKMVLVIGGGNSGFETADFLSDTAAIVHVSINKRINFAWDTHFVGDLRAVNNNLLDMYNLKSMHATFAYQVVKVAKEENGKFVVTFKNLATHLEEPGWMYSEIKYDHVISCMGWRYTTPEIFDESILIDTVKDNRYPKLSNCWETDTENLFYIGTAMASIDRHAASGFIHGFRYNIRTLHNLLEQRFYDKELPHEILPSRDLQAIADKFFERASLSAALYQMHTVLCDVITFDEEGHTLYYTDLPKRHILERPEFKSAKDIFVATLTNLTNKAKALGRAKKPVEGFHGPNFTKYRCGPLLHPKFEHYRYGEYVDQVELAESAVVRYDELSAKMFPGLPQSLNDNYIKYFINDKMNWTDEEFDLFELLSQLKLFRVPLSEEEMSRRQREWEVTECPYSRALLPKHKVVPQKINLRPTKEEVLASA